MTITHRMVQKSGTNVGQVFPLEIEEISIGRDANNQLVIPDPEVSRRHARIFRHADNYVIEDLGSTNGTFVNGSRLVGPYILRAGETVTLGENTNLVYEVEDPDATMAAFSPSATYQAPPEPQLGPIMVEEPPENEFSGKIPDYGESQAPRKKKKLSFWFVLLIIFLLFLFVLCTALIIIEVFNLYCYFPDLVNFFIPGGCPQ